MKVRGFPSIEARRKYNRDYRKALRCEMLFRGGGKCKRCEETDWRVLQVDHVNGGGHRSGETGKMLTRMRVELILERIERGELQILCANCNWRKRYQQGETRLYVDA